MKIRRRGRHTTPSQVEKVAEKAGKAAPVFAIAGALVASPQAQHATIRPAAIAAAQAHKPTAAHQQMATPDSVASHGSIARVTSTRHAAARAAARNMYYRVQAGDTLSKIAERYYHNAGDWPWLYHENAKTIRDPNLIYTGETLIIPDYVPKHSAPGGYVPKHAKPGAVRTTSSTHHSDGAKKTTVTEIKGNARSGHGWGGGGSGKGILRGNLGCSGLEQLWDEAGGNPHDAFIAAEIAMAESGGHQYALSPTDDYGYWQINASHGSLATFDPYGNARAAVIISNDGTDWYPWTTYTSGAYIGRC
jgi:LysM repeat protein